MQDDLESFRPWLLKVAQSLVGPKEAEDVAQEGWLYMWRTEGQHNPALSPKNYWMKQKAYSRMLNVRRSLKNKMDKVVFVEEYEDPLMMEWLRPDLENIYHNREVLAAIMALTPREREYVYLRFWRGYQMPQLREHFGYEPNAAWTLAKRKLQKSLSHLRELA